jgi:hypothetical protein
VFAFSGHITGPGVYALDIGVPNGLDSFLGSGEFVDAILDYRLVTGGFLTVTLPGVPETGGTLFSLVIGIIALSGFRLLGRNAVLGITFLSIQSLALAQTVTLSVTGTPSSGNPYSVEATVTGINSVSKVQFVNSDNNAIIRTDATAPYCIFGDTIPNPCNFGRLGGGTHHVVAKAYETGIPTARATSAILTITEPFLTRVSRNGENFLINGLVTHPGTPLEGTLPNSRMVQATFDDANPNTVGNWRYPDGSPYSAARQTNEFVAALPNYKAKGLLAVTLNFQGGNPIHGATQQPWDNTAFNSDGTLKSAYLRRMDKAIRALDARGMIAILGYFYQGQDQRLANESAIRAAVTNATAWVLNKGYTNVMIEVVNESGNAGINYPILQPARVNELITAVQNQSRNFGRPLLTATSFNGGVTTGIPTNVRSSEDFILLHGNNQTATQITSMISTVRSWNLNKPIIFNEDDPVMAKFQAATNGHASWGYLDPGTNNYFDGFQSPPTNWSINTNLKQTFFNKVADLSTP